MSNLTPSVTHQREENKAGTLPPLVYVAKYIVPRTDLSPSAKLVALAIADYINMRPGDGRFGLAWPSFDTLAAAAGVGRATVARVVPELVAAGVLVVKSGTQHVPNLYGLEGVTPGPILAALADASRGSTPLQDDASSLKLRPLENPSSLNLDSSSLNLDASSLNLRPDPPIILLPIDREDEEKSPLTVGRMKGNAADSVDAPAVTGLPEIDPGIAKAWVAAFGPMTEQAAKGIANQVREHSAPIVAVAVERMAAQVAKGKSIDRPGAYLKSVCRTVQEEHMQKSVEEAQAAEKPAQAGDTGSDWQALAEQTAAHREPVAQVVEPARREAGRVLRGELGDAWHALAMREAERYDKAFGDWLKACRPAQSVDAGGALRVSAPSGAYVHYVSRMAGRFGRELGVMTGGKVSQVQFSVKEPFTEAATA